MRRWRAGLPDLTPHGALCMTTDGSIRGSVPFERDPCVFATFLCTICAFAPVDHCWCGLEIEPREGVPDAEYLTDSEAGHMVKHRHSLTRPRSPLRHTSTHTHTACKALTTLSMHHRYAAFIALH